MATRTLRRGLPRVPGGEPWPPGLAVDVGEGDVSTSPSSLGEQESASPVVAERESASPVVESAVASPVVDPVEAASPVVERGAERRDETHHAASAPPASVRRGLPRMPGGEPWPPAGVVPIGAEGVSSRSASPSSLDEQESAPPAVAAAVASPVVESAAPSPVVERGAQRRDETRHAASAAATASSVRRGLPRTPGAVSYTHLTLPTKA